MRSGRGARRRRLIVAAITMLGAGACGLAPSANDPTATDPVAESWHVYPSAFAANGDFNVGPTVLLSGPGACFTAFGRDSTGYGTISASWIANGDCTTTTATSRTGRGGSGDGLPSQDKVGVIAGSPAAGGGYLILTRRTFPGDAFGYETTASIGTPGNDLRDVARFSGGGRSAHNGPDSVITIEGGYAAAGYIEATPTVWTSPDGLTWHATDLPDAGQRQLNLVAGPQIAVGPHGQLVVIGAHQGGNDSVLIDAWYSNDAGATWFHGTTPQNAGFLRIQNVIHNGHEYVAFGAATSGSNAPALVLRSIDGIAWTRDTSIDTASVPALVAATVLPDGSLLAFAATSAHGPTPTDSSGKPQVSANTQCAAAWIQTNGSWRHEDIGCHGAPDAVTVLSDGRVAAARGGYLFLRNAGGS